MHYSFFSRIRDILLLCALFFLVKSAFDRTTTFINAHEKSFVHELDRNFMDHMYTAQRQLHFLEQHSVHGAEFTTIIADLKNRLATIEEKYKTNSPGVMLLGPIGSAAIVTKEEKLQKKLLELVNDLSKILHTISNQKHVMPHTETIESALNNNKILLQTLTA